MFATVQFAGAASSAKPVLLVPAEAVIRTGKRNVVIVAQAEGRYAPVEVELGRESGDSVEIRKGLEPGAKVVASGQFMIDSEASLKGVLARMGDGAEATSGPARRPCDARGQPACRRTRPRAWCAPWATRC